MRCLLTLLALALLPGCELLRLERAPADDGRNMMMLSDLVPLAPKKNVYAGDTMSVPVEPSRFQLKANGRPPAAMLSDIQPPASPAAKPRDETWAIPKEPIP